MADEPYDGPDLAGQRLDKAMSQRKKQFQHMKNIIGRQVKQRNKEDRMRLTLFKESYKGKKEVPKRKKPWTTIEWQTYWNSLDDHQQNNLDRKKSHCHESINSKIDEMAENFNASVVCLIRYPNGTQHTKYVLASGGGIKYAKTEDGILTNQLWHRYWNKKQEKRHEMCAENGVWLERASKRKKTAKKKGINQDSEDESELHEIPKQRNSFEKEASKTKKKAKKKGVDQDSDNEPELHENPKQRKSFEKEASKTKKKAKKTRMDQQIENETVLRENLEQRNSIEREKKKTKERKDERTGNNKMKSAKERAEEDDDDQEEEEMEKRVTKSTKYSPPSPLANQCSPPNYQEDADILLPNENDNFSPLSSSPLSSRLSPFSTRSSSPNYQYREEGDIYLQTNFLTPPQTTSKRVVDGTAGSAAATLEKYIVFHQDRKLSNLPCVQLDRLPASFLTQGKPRGQEKGRLPGRPKGRGKVQAKIKNRI